MQLAIFIKDIKTTKEKKNPATKVFQALRMEVNSEIDNLYKCLISLKNLIKKGGKIIVISFHSIEDRLVKNLFKHKEKIHEKKVQNNYLNLLLLDMLKFFIGTPVLIAMIKRQL